MIHGDYTQSTRPALRPRGPMSRGLSCDARGVFLGPRCGLVHIEAGHYVARTRGELGVILRSAYGYRGDAAPLARALDRIRERLEADDVDGAGRQAEALALPDLADERAVAVLDRTLDLLARHLPEGLEGMGEAA